MGRQLVAVVAVGALLVGVAGTAANAEPTPPPAAGSSGQSANSDALKVIVGKTVALTTDQAGTETPLNLLILNTQASGQGSAQIQIPTSTTGSKTVDINSNAGDVKNSISLAGSYGGELPVTISTAVTVDGKTIDPNTAYDLNGEVQITYTFVNHTSRQQTITYKDLYGTTTSKQVDVPVPFGNSYSVKFGDGWRIEDPGAMSMRPSPTGTALSATVVLFPIVPGVGGTTQTLTVKAQADNASLPATTSTIVPIDLSTYFGGAALELVPMVESKVLTPLNSTLDSVLGTLFSATKLLSNYTAGFQTLNTKGIDPLVQQIDKINVDPNKLTNTLTQLSTGLTDLGKLMNANAGAQAQIANVLTKLSKVVGVSLPKLLKGLGADLAALGGTNGPAATAAAALMTLDGILSSPAMNSLGTNAAVVKPVCNAVAPTSVSYGPVKENFLIVGGGGYTALVAALKPQAQGGLPTHSTARPQLVALQTALNSQVTSPTGTLWPAALYDYAAMIGAIVATKAGPAAGAAVTELLSNATCSGAVPLAEGLALLPPVWNKLGVPTIAKDLTAISNIGTNPTFVKLANEIVPALTKVSALLSNDNCTAADIVDPITAALKQYGAAGIKAHLKSVLAQVFSDCGVSQLIAYFGLLDKAIGTASGKLGVMVDGLVKDVPTIAADVDKVKKISDVVGKAFDSIPGVGQKIADAINGKLSAGETTADTDIAKVSNYTEELQSTLVAMNDRTLAGDGSPYGPATGPNTKTMSAYQITMQEASPYGRNWAISIALGLFFLAIAVGLGTFLYRRRRAQ